MREVVNLDGAHGFYKAIDLSLRNVPMKIRSEDTRGYSVGLFVLVARLIYGGCCKISRMTESDD